MVEKGDEVYCETSLAAPNRAQFMGTVTSTLIWANLCRFYALANSGLSLLVYYCLFVLHLWSVNGGFHTSVCSVILLVIRSMDAASSA
jgi:hypothetical protein